MINASGRNPEKWCGTRTSSTRALNNQIEAIWVAEPVSNRATLTGSQCQSGRTYGQKRRKMSAAATAGATATGPLPEDGWLDRRATGHPFPKNVYGPGAGG